MADMSVRRRELLPGVHLTGVQGDRYKTNALTAYFVRPLNGGEASLNALLPQVMCRGSRRWPDLRSLSEAADDLYGASLMGGVRKLGELQTLGISCDYIGDAFTEPGQTSGVAELMAETLLCPATVGGAFNPDYVLSERDKLIDALRAQKNDKAAYAMRRLETLACADEPYGVDRLGDEESMAAITPESLWEHFNKVIASSRLELFYCGQSEDIDDILRDALGSRLESVSRRAPEEKLPAFVARAGSPRAFEESMEVTQSKLALLWRAGVPPGHGDTMAAYLAAALYGGGTTGKLFTNVREKLSLCYYAAASMDRHKGVMKAQSGVEPSEAVRAKGEILRQWDELAAGRFTDEDMANARALLTNAWRSQCDSPGGLEHFWHGQAVSGQTESIQEWETALGRVTRDDVIRVAGGFTLDATYTLNPQSGGGTT